MASCCIWGVKTDTSDWVSLHPIPGTHLWSFWSISPLSNWIWDYKSNCGNYHLWRAEICRSFCSSRYQCISWHRLVGILAIPSCISAEFWLFCHLRATCHVAHFMYLFGKRGENTSTFRFKNSAAVCKTTCVVWWDCSDNTGFWGRFRAPELQFQGVRVNRVLKQQRNLKINSYGICEFTGGFSILGYFLV